jgi:hypothetical protein
MENIEPELQKKMNRYIERAAILAKLPKKNLEDLNIDSVQLELIKDNIDDFNSLPNLQQGLNATVVAFSTPTDSQDETRLARTLDNPMGFFLEHAPEDFRKIYNEDFIKSANEVLKPPVEDLLKKFQARDGMGCFWCQVGIWAALLIIVGAVLYFTAGTAMAVLIGLVGHMLIVSLAFAIGVAVSTIEGILAGVAVILIEAFIYALCQEFRACN